MAAKNRRARHALYCCLEKFLTVWRTAAPGCPRRRLESLRHRSFHALWVGQRPMNDCLKIGK
jgi:hypothetical protein